MTDKAEYEIINIEGQNYMVVMQKLKRFRFGFPMTGLGMKVGRLD